MRPGENLRVLIVSGIFPPDIGGPATYVPQIADGLEHRGHTVTVVTLSDRLDHDDRNYAFHVVRLSRLAWRPWRWFQTITMLCRLGWRVDVLFVNGLALEAVLANLMLRKPLVHKVVADLAWERATIWGWVKDTFENFQLARYGLRVELLRKLRAWWTCRADVVIVPSRYLARWVAGWGVPEKKLMMIHNAARALNGNRCNQVYLTTPLKAVTVGRLIPLKRIDDVIRVVAGLNDVGLLIVGDGPERPHLEGLVRSLGVPDRVQFAGQRTTEETLALMATCDLFVLNSTHEGFPHVVVEALGLGLPVVATAVGGTPEAVQDGYNGRLISPHDDGALASALSHLVVFPEERRRLGDGAARSAGLFGFEQMVEETEAKLQIASRNGHATELTTPPARRAWEAVWAPIMRGRFVRNVSALTFSNVLTALMNVLGGVLIARLLGPEQYGIAALVLSYPSLVFTFFDARSVEASVKYLSEFQARGERDRALAMCKLGYALDAMIACVALLFAMATASWAARWVVHREDTAWLMMVYAAAYLPRALVSTSYAVFSTLGRFALVAWTEVFSTVLRVLLTVGFVLAGWNVAGIVWGTALATSATGIFYGTIGFLQIRRVWGASPLHGSWRALTGRRREIVGFLLYNDLIALLGMVPKQLDVVLLGHFRNSTDVGYYKLAKGIGGFVGNIVGPLQSVMYPELARLWGLGEWHAVRERTRRLASQIGLPLGVAALSGIVLLPLLVPALVGQAYRPAVSAAQFLLVGSATWLTFFWLRPLYLVRGELKAWANITLAAVILSAIGFFVIIPSWGFQGLAIWTMLVTLVNHATALLYVKLRNL